MGVTPGVEIRRSDRRRRTVSARFEAGRIVVMVPAGLDARAEGELVDRMVRRLTVRKSRAVASDDQLMARAAQLSRTYLDGRAQPSSVRYVSNQTTRWASVTLRTGAVRVSQRMVGMPTWVLDAVLLHELAHLLEPSHGPAFQRLVTQYPRHAEAQAYLAGAAFGMRLEADPDDTTE